MGCEELCHYIPSVVEQTLAAWEHDYIGKEQVQVIEHLTSLRHKCFTPSHMFPRHSQLETNCQVVLKNDVQYAEFQCRCFVGGKFVQLYGCYSYYSFQDVYF